MNERERLGPPPIEPLSDIAWSRVERGLWSRLDAATPATSAAAPPRLRRWTWAWIAAPAFAAAAAIALVVGIRGDAPGGEVAPARVVTGDSPTSVSFGDIHVKLDANSAVVMDAAPSALLERGAAWFAVAPRGERPPFVVAAGDLVVRVLGTRFRVARSGEESVVEVEHGLVEVQFHDVLTRVGAGQHWTSRRPAEVEPVRVADAALAPITSAAPATAPVAIIDPAPAAPPPPAQPEPSHRAAPQVAAAAPKPVAPKVSAPKPAAPKAVAPQAVAPRPEQPRIDADEAAFHRLETLEPRSPKAAIDGYLELSRRSSRWAEPALYAAARLAADRKEARAKTLLEIYLRRFPRGGNAADARTLLGHLQGAH